MKFDSLSYRDVFQAFGIQPVYESSCCCLLKDHNRHFCVYHDKDTGKIGCIYMNILEPIHQRDLLLLLSPYQALQLVSHIDSGDEYQFRESVSSDFIVKWCYCIRQAGFSDDMPAAARDVVSLFDNGKDIFIGEDNHIKIVIRDKNGTITDLLQYRDNDFEASFSNRFGSWDDRPDTSSLLHNLYTRNPYLIPPFFEENNPYHYHVHVVSGYHFPEFSHLFNLMASNVAAALEPSFFLLGSLKDYIDFSGFLCHYATVKSKKNFFNYYQYTDHIVFEIIPFDSPLGHTGLTYKSWQTRFSQKMGDDLRVDKWQTGTGIYTGVPLKIDILHRLCLDFIHLNKLSIRIVNRVLDVESGEDTEGRDQLNASYHEQIF